MHISRKWTPLHRSAPSHRTNLSVVNSLCGSESRLQRERRMNLIVAELQFERAAHSLLAATDLAANLRKNHAAIFLGVQKYASRLSEDCQANAALLLQYLEKVSHARFVGDFADAACVLSKGQLELSSRQVSELVTLAQKTTIIAQDTGSAAPTPPRPIPGRPDEAPLPGPGGPRTPYPVNDPGIADPGKPGSEPDYMPSPLPGVDPPAI
jgi:hypothetical protein